MKGVAVFGTFLLGSLASGQVAHPSFNVGATGAGYASANNLPFFPGYQVNAHAGASGASVPSLGGMETGKTDTAKGQQSDEGIFTCDLYVPGPVSLATSVQSQLLSQTAAYSASAPVATNVQKIGSSTSTAYNVVTFLTRQGLVKKAYELYKKIIGDSAYASVNDVFAKGIQCTLKDFVNEELYMEIEVRTAAGGAVSSAGPWLPTYTEGSLFSARRRMLTKKETAAAQPVLAVPYYYSTMPNYAYAKMPIAHYGTYGDHHYGHTKHLYPTAVGATGLYPMMTGGLSSYPYMTASYPYGISTPPAYLNKHGKVYSPAGLSPFTGYGVEGFETTETGTHKTSTVDLTDAAFADLESIQVAVKKDQLSEGVTVNLPLHGNWVSEAPAPVVARQTTPTSVHIKADEPAVVKLMLKNDDNSIANTKTLQIDTY